MKNFERSVLLCYVVSLILKYFHIPGGVVFLLLSTLVLGVTYLVALPKMLTSKIIREDNLLDDQHITSYNKSSISVPLIRLSGVVLTVTLIGILFDILYWPGSEVMILFGTGASLIFVVNFSVQYFAKKDSGIVPLLIRMLFFSLLSLSCFLINL